jgi:diacylglycerol kinase family enzyme
MKFFWFLCYTIYIKEGKNMKKCVLIINPKSGKNLENSFLYEYQEILQKYNYETVIYFTSYAK